MPSWQNYVHLTIINANYPHWCCCFDAAFVCAIFFCFRVRVFGKFNFRGWGYWDVSINFNFWVIILKGGDLVSWWNLSNACLSVCITSTTRSNSFPMIRDTVGSATASIQSKISNGLLSVVFDCVRAIVAKKALQWLWLRMWLRFSLFPRFWLVIKRQYYFSWGSDSPWRSWRKQEIDVSMQPMLYFSSLSSSISPPCWEAACLLSVQQCILKDATHILKLMPCSAANFLQKLAESRFWEKFMVAFQLFFRMSSMNLTQNSVFRFFVSLPWSILHAPALPSIFWPPFSENQSFQWYFNWLLSSSSNFWPVWRT